MAVVETNQKYISPSRSAVRALAYTRANRSRFLEELKQFVKFPSVSGQPKHKGDVKLCAQWLANHLKTIGLSEVNLILTPGHPIVYARGGYVQGRPTLLIYGHYDVQPVDPISAWKRPPFEPTILGDYLLGRGASDDKGQLFAHIKAIESFLATASGLPINVKCLFEGEEEIGSRHLLRLLRQCRQEMDSDVIVVSDTCMLGPNRPAITYSLRGSLSLEMMVRGPKHDLHSGTFGGAIHNPIQVLSEILARLHDADGRVTIPGFYDRVRLLSSKERAYMAHTGPGDAQILQDTGVEQGFGESGFTLYERTTIRPALTLNGIVGGYSGAGNKSIIPSHAIAKLNFRFVPDQNPRRIERLFRAYITHISPPTVFTAIRVSGPAAKPVVVNHRHPIMHAAILAYRDVFGRAPVFIRSGGTIPIVSTFDTELGRPIILMGFGLPDDRVHAPNEKFFLPNFYKGIATSIRFIIGLTKQGKRSFPAVAKPAAMPEG